MSPRVLVVVQRLALLAAILASAALIIDYQNIGDPTFCGAESSCFRVRASDIGRDLAGLAASLSIGKGKVTVPHVGVLAHVFLMALALAASTRFWMRVVAGVATVGAAAAVYLLVAQLRIGELCPWCAVVDVSSIVCAISSVLLARAAGSEREPAWGREGQTGTSVVVWSVAATAMVALPYIWFNYSAAAPLPPPIQALQEPGKVTVVSFTDFECPFCRKLAPTLQPMHEDPGIAFKRIMAPLDMHPGARPAAIAYLCIDEDLRDDYARLLYESPDGAFSPGNLEWIAVNKAHMKKTREDFEACMKSPETEKKLDAEIQLFKDAGGSGLPTTYVGRRMVKGLQPEKVLAALEAEKRGVGIALPVWAMFVAAAAVGAWTTAMHLRAARALPAPSADGDRDRDRDEDDASAKRARKAGKAAAPRDEVPTRDERPKKAKRKPATTAADSPRAKRAQSAPPPADGAPQGEDGDVVVSGDAPALGEDGGEKA